MLLKTLAQLGRYLQNKRNFMTYWLISTGIPGAVGSVWWLGKYGGILFSLFLVIVAFAGAYLGGLLMWEFYVKGFLGIRGTDNDK